MQIQRGDVILITRHLLVCSANQVPNRLSSDPFSLDLQKINSHSPSSPAAIDKSTMSIQTAKSTKKITQHNKICTPSNEKMENRFGNGAREEKVIAEKAVSGEFKEGHHW